MQTDVAGHPEQPLQAHGAAVTVLMQHGGAGGRPPPVPGPQALLDQLP